MMPLSPPKPLSDDQAQVLAHFLAFAESFSVKSKALYPENDEFAIQFYQDSGGSTATKMTDALGKLGIGADIKAKKEDFGTGHIVTVSFTTTQPLEDVAQAFKSAARINHRQNSTPQR